MSPRVYWVLAGLLCFRWAAAGTPDAGTLLKDLFAVSITDNHFTEVVWVPEELAVQLRSPPQERAAQLMAGLAPFEIFAVLDAAVNSRDPSFSDEELLRRSVTVEDGKGHRLRLVDEAAAPAELKRFFQSARPFFATQLGPLGAHVVLLAFSAMGEDGQRLVEPTKGGSHGRSRRLHHISLPSSSGKPLAADARSEER
jgi:hypothetical protein